MSNETNQDADEGPVQLEVRAAFDAWLASLKPEDRYNFDSEGRCFKKVDGHMMRLAWDAAWNCQQATIDRLMLEHCAEEMTADQMAEWARSQKPLDPEIAAVLAKNISDLYEP